MKTLYMLIAFLFLVITIDQVAQQKTKSENGKSVVNISFDEISNFYDGMAAVKKGNRWGFIDINGNLKVEVKYGDFAFEELKFSDGLARVYSPEEDQIGFVDKEGNVVIPFSLYSVSHFNDGLACAYTPAKASNPNSTAHWYVIDKTGKVVIPDMKNGVSFTTYYSEGRAKVQRWIDNEIFYGFIDTEGKNVGEIKYYDIRDFSDGMAAVMGYTETGEYKWGFIDYNGNLKIPFTFKNEPKPFSNGRTFVLSNEFKWGIIDKEGKIIVEPKFKQVFPFSDGVAVVSEMDKAFFEEWKIIDVDGKVLKSYPKPKKDNERVTFWSGFVEGMAIVQKGYSFEMCAIDKTGKEMFEPKYRKIIPYNGGIAYAEYFDKNEKKVTVGYINKKGQWVIINTKPAF